MSNNPKAFTEFVRGTTNVKVPRDERSYRNGFGRASYGYRSMAHDGYSKEEITQILEEGSPSEVQALTAYFSKVSGIYASTIEYLSSLLNYNYLLTPHYDISSPPQTKKLKASYRKYASYIKYSYLKRVLPQINQQILRTGVYYGIVRESEEEDSLVFYQLPSQFCRSRFLDKNGNAILEINCSYFSTVANGDENALRSLLSLFPRRVKSQVLSRIGGNKEQWIEILPHEGGMCFYFKDDYTSPLASSTLAVLEEQNARVREAARDENEMHKLLIQKLPIDKSDGTLIFSLEEAAELHKGVCDMLADNDTIDVMTTYADVKLEEVQEPDAAASSSASRQEKYKSNIYNDIGISTELFNASGANTMKYSIKKDISMLMKWSRQYEIWLNTWLYRKAANKNKNGKPAFYFSIQFLPTTEIFRDDDISTYLKTAQYGYPKMAVSAAMDLEPLDVLQMIDFENTVLKLHDNMVPLQSSYTSSGDEKNSSGSEKNSNQKTSGKNLENEGGRPEKKDEDKSDRTLSNRDGMT